MDSNLRRRLESAVGLLRSDCRRLDACYEEATSLPVLDSGRGIILFWLVESALLLDVLVLGNWNLQDRVLLDFTLLGQRAKFYVAPFMLSRIITIVVWSGRFVFVTATRHNDNALILLRGNVEFDLERWKREAYSDPLRTIQRQSVPGKDFA